MTDETAPETQDLEQVIDDASDAVAVQANQLAELATGVPMGDQIGLDNLLEVPVRVTVQIGRAQMTLGDLVQLGPGSLIPLDREAHEPVDILVNGKVVARGEVVTIDNTYGVRITSVHRDE